MNLHTIRNELKYPARVASRWILAEAAVLVAIAALAFLLMR